MPSTRLDTKLAPKRAALAAMREEYIQRFAALDAKLADTKCYICNGSEGPLTCENARLLICGHACHDACDMKARLMQMEEFQNALNGQYTDAPLTEAAIGLRCGFCRYKRTGNDGFDLFLLRMKILSGTSAFKCSSIHDVEREWTGRVRMLQSLSDKLSLCEGTFDGTYTPDRPYPSEHFEQGCTVM